MKSIGGFFEFELKFGKEYHYNAIKLNSGRNALEYILRIRKYKEIYIPWFTCNVIVEPLVKLNIPYKFYHIDNKFEPILDGYEYKPGTAFLYTNYFGMKGKFIKELKIKNLVIDNSQAFFDIPHKGIDSFYSPRKFFGVPDGSYLYTNKEADFKLNKDCSYKRTSHLLKRADCGPERAYDLFKRNDALISRLPLRTMSDLTSRLLCSINYSEVRKRRIENTEYVHSEFYNINKIKINIKNITTLCTFPLLIEKTGLKEVFTHQRNHDGCPLSAAC